MDGSEANSTPVAHQCTILSDGFDIAVQITLGASAIALLLVKWRVCERVPRTFWVFFADNSKQCAGFFVAHVGNMIMSELLETDASPCVWYVVNIFFDCTLRVAMAYVLLQVVMDFCRRQGYTDLIFGEYREFNEMTRSEAFCVWWKQSWLWVFIVATTRAILGVLFWVFADPLSDAGTWVMGPLERHTEKHGHDLELVMAMIVIPFALVAFQLWVQDSFLQSGTHQQGDNCLVRCCPCLCGQRGGDGGPAYSSTVQGGCDGVAGLGPGGSIVSLPVTAARGWSTNEYPDDAESV
eukprot:TRINITY_DN12306_c2_g1_i1.p1 TRINITY_DN12306_c2_g1~~TRINITY_DN12306_c2_g1_i1.p1  ORF type:complete len:295 (+),score=80.35 TRINITY_DN12306_c2_g1_i1:173-1057(+)